MAVNKNFVVKNGIEVATDLIFASSDLDKVGIGSTIPTQLLEVGGDTKVTGNTELVGVTTLSGDGGITTTGGDLFVGGTISGSGANLTSLPSAQLTGALPAIDGSALTGVVADSGGSLGFSTANSIGYGVTFLKFVGAGVSTLSSPHSGIATLTIVGGGGGGSASIGIGTTQGDAFSTDPVAGNLWYNTNEARLFIYYNDGSSAQWVDAAPFNIGIITSGLQSLAQGTALSPSLAFSGDSSTGLFSPTTSKQTFVSAGASILNVNPGGIDVTGIVTSGGFKVGTGISIVGSGIEVTGIVTSGGFKVGTGISIVGSGVAATAFYGDGSNLTNVVNSVIAGDNISVSGSTGNVTITGLANTSNVIADTVSTGTLNVTGISTFTGQLSGAGASFTGNVSVGGTLTYEDVTNVDSIGVVTARSGIEFGVAGVGGTITADGYSTLEGGLNVVGVTSVKHFEATGRLVEKVNVTAGKLSDNININLDNGMVHLFTTQETTTSTPNIMSSTGINTDMDVGDAISVTIITTAAAGAYSAQLTIDGSSVTENWTGGSAPSDGGSSGVDIHAYTIMKTASATYTVLATQTKTS